MPSSGGGGAHHGARGGGRRAAHLLEVLLRADLLRFPDGLHHFERHLLLIVHLDAAAAAQQGRKVRGAKGAAKKWGAALVARPDECVRVCCVPSAGPRRPWSSGEARWMKTSERQGGIDRSCAIGASGSSFFSFSTTLPPSVSIRRSWNAFFSFLSNRVAPASWMAKTERATMTSVGTHAFSDSASVTRGRSRRKAKDRRTELDDVVEGRAEVNHVFSLWRRRRGNGAFPIRIRARAHRGRRCELAIRTPFRWGRRELGAVDDLGRHGSQPKPSPTAR